MSDGPAKYPGAASLQKSPARVLFVVDDDAAVLTSLKFALELEGFEVRTYSDAQSLLRKPEIGRNDFLVIDYRLPDTNGLDLIERLRAKGVMARTVLITSNPSQDVCKKAAALSVPILEKPLFDNSLIKTIRESRTAAVHTA